MRSVLALREASARGARSVVGLAVAAAVALGCSVDDNGLAETNVKLQRPDGGFGGTIASSGGATGSGGMIAGGGTTGSGGTSATGGAPGTGGAGASTGSGGTPGTGGTIGGGGTTGTGGAPGTGGAIGTGGMPNAGGTTGSGGTPGTGGVMTTGGTTGTGGAPGTGGTTGAGGTIGTGGIMATGGTTGTGGIVGTGGSGPPACGPGNCSGCCSADGQCIHNTGPRQCGNNGSACVACGGCQMCANGACAINPSSQWTIVAQSATVSMTPPGAATWDPSKGDEGGSAPDLFCEYENPFGDVSATTAGVTDTVTDVFTANWDQTITPAGVTVSAQALMVSKPAWRIWVGDEDCINPNNCGTLGQIACSYQQSISASALESGQLTISNFQNCVSIQLQLVCQDPTATPP
jgi:hypothetical protein